MALLSPKRRGLLVNSLSDISKEALIALPAGLATGKPKLFYAVVAFLGSMLAFAAASLLKDSNDAARNGTGMGRHLFLHRIGPGLSVALLYRRKHRLQN